MGRSAPARRRPPRCQVWVRAGRAAVACVLSGPISLAAQETVVVSGQVYDANTSSGVSNALVQLVGHGQTLTTASGSFRLEGVRVGDYVIRVEALGYLELETPLHVATDTIVAISVSADPVALDPFEVELGRLDFDGRVLDGVSDSRVPDAEILSDQGHVEHTNVHGRFDLDDVFERIPLRLLISAFGYMPLDTAFVPDDEARYPFRLEDDELIRRMIAVQTRLLDDRAAERIYEFQPAINREDMDRFDSTASLQTVMERFYPRHILRKIGCFFLDEREIRFSSREHAVNVIQGTMANDLQRIELYEFPGPGRLFMVRIYTRYYFQRTVGSDLELREPSMTFDGRFCR